MYHGGTCCEEKHMCMRLEYCIDDAEQWASDIEYIEDVIRQVPQSMLDDFAEVLDCSVCWSEGNGDGDTEDMCEAIEEWYDTLFRPHIRQMVRFDMHHLGIKVNWKAFEVYCFEMGYTQCDTNHPCGTMMPVMDKFKEVRA